MVISTYLSSKLKGKITTKLEVISGNTITVRTNPRMPEGGALYIKMKTLGNYKEEGEIAVTVKEALFIIEKLSKGVNKVLKENHVTDKDDGDYDNDDMFLSNKMGRY